MQAYEFLTQISTTGQVLLPPQYINEIPLGTRVRVLVLVDENEAPTNRYYEKAEDLSPLERLIAEIKQMPRNPAKFTAGRGLLAKHLAHPVNSPDPDFDPKAWDQIWDQLEAQMKAQSLGHEAEKMKDLSE